MWDLNRVSSARLRRGGWIALSLVAMAAWPCAAGAQDEVFSLDDEDVRLRAPEVARAVPEPRADDASDLPDESPERAADAEAATQASAPASGPPGGSIIDTTGWDLQVDPFLVVVGGVHAQFIVPRDDADEREDRFTVVALSRLGMRARFGPHLSLESEVEVSAGPHGTSVWEGQAALQIRNQLLRIDWEGLRIDAGRITDPTSLDYQSAYVANMLLTDPLTRYPLLVSGFNRGNGVMVRYNLWEGLHVGATVNAGNPTSTTGTVMIGGTFPPFARFYEVPWSHVGRDARGFPLDSMHVLLVAPHLAWESPYLRAQAAVQVFVANTDTNSFGDENLTGYNIRLGLRGILFDGAFQPFANFSRILNDTVEPTDIGTLSQSYYEGITFSGGFDVALYGLSGLGAQYSLVREQVDGGSEQIRHFVNVGGSLAIFPFLAVDARYGMVLQCNDGECGQEQEHSLWLTLRATIGSAAGVGGRP